MIKNLLAMLAIVPIRVYQLAVSPWLPVSCRFQPTCSEYAIAAIKEQGAVKGTWLAVRRLGRCHPWGGSGFDPVPCKKQVTLQATPARKRTYS
jgi:putative membrane protein insertion efficiency factor